MTRLHKIMGQLNETVPDDHVSFFREASGDQSPVYYTHDVNGQYHSVQRNDDGTFQIIALRMNS